MRPAALPPGRWAPTTRVPYFSPGTRTPSLRAAPPAPWPSAETYPGSRDLRREYKQAARPTFNDLYPIIRDVLSPNCSDKSKTATCPIVRMPDTIFAMAFADFAFAKHPCERECAIATAKPGPWPQLATRLQSAWWSPHWTLMQ